MVRSRRRKKWTIGERCGNLCRSLKLFPEQKKLSSEEEKYSAYVISKSERAIHAKLRFTLVNHHEGRNNKSQGMLLLALQFSNRVHDAKELKHTFAAGSSNWCWTDFVKIKELHDPAFGFNVDGWLTFTIYILIGDQTMKNNRQPEEAKAYPQMSHQKAHCGFRGYDQLYCEVFFCLGIK